MAPGSGLPPPASWAKFNDNWFVGRILRVAGAWSGPIDMTDLLETIAELTHLRNRHELERAFAQLVYRLAEASCLILWQVARQGGEVKLRQRVKLPHLGLEEDLPPPLPECRSCLESANPVCSRVAENKAARHVYPIHDGARVCGLLEVTRPEPFTRLEEHMLASLIKVYGNHAGLLDYGERDELTGLLNRRSFSTLFNQASTSMCGVIAVLDIDFFKRINDEFGHPYGDEVLILMARLMEQTLSEADGVFRFGGEEFLVLLGGANLDDAWHMLETFRARVQSAVFPQVGRVTISIGFAGFGPSDTGASAFGRADEALYVAKQRGRNQVQCHEWLVAEGCLADGKKAGSEVELF
jgi:diguanylate cyclase (GGDEF)-like protein